MGKDQVRLDQHVVILCDNCVSTETPPSRLPVWKPSGSEAICTQRVYKLSGSSGSQTSHSGAAIRSVRLWRAITTSSVIIGDDCFQEVAKLISMADIRRVPDLYSYLLLDH